MDVEDRVILSKDGRKSSKLKKHLVIFRKIEISKIADVRHYVNNPLFPSIKHLLCCYDRSF